MAYKVVKNCPLNFKDWANQARLKCSNGNTYHCVEDELSRIVEVCTTPLWIQRGHCPIYNTGLKQIDSLECTAPNCPSEVYRSDAVYKYRCYQRFTTRITPGSMQTTIQVPITYGPNVVTIVSAVITVFVVVLLVILGIIIWRKKIQCLNPCIFKRAENGERDTHSATAGEEDLSCEESLLNNQQANDSGLQKTFQYLKYVFSPNDLYKQAISVLELYNCLTIIGPPGSGKTITALQLAYRKCVVGERSRMYFCRTIEEVESTATGKEDAYIIVDDWLDRYIYYPSTLLPAIASLTKFCDEFVKNGKVHLILTAQKDKWAMFRDFLTSDIFNPESLLIIKGVHEKERHNIIIHHFRHLRIEEGDEKLASKYLDNRIVVKGTQKKLAEKIKGEEEFSFPVIIDLICTNERLRVPNTLNLIFKDGFCKILKTFFDNWYQEKDIMERKSFCILVFAALLGGKISTSDFEDSITGPLFERVCKKYRNLNNKKEINKKKQVSTEENEIRKEKISDKDNLDQKQPLLEENENWGELLADNRRLRGCLYQISDTNFIFQHSSLFRFVLSFIKDKEEQFFIENVNIKVLMNQCWIDEVFIVKLRAENKEIPLKYIYPIGSVVLSNGALRALVKRIRSEKEQHVGYDITEWDNHIFMSQKTFKKMWEDNDSEKSHQSQN